MITLVAATGCVSTCDCRERAASGAAAAAEAPVVSGLPVPPGPDSLPRPAGIPSNFRILDWAGFKSAVSYTFDDAQPSQIEHYAELAATGVRMTFFVNATGPDQAALVSTFSRAARDGHEIGNHTAHHCHADPDGTLYNTDGNNQRTACPGASAGAEYDDCTTFIASSLGAPHVWTAASPFGNEGFEEAAAQRFFLSRGVMRGSISPNDDTDPFRLPQWGPDAGDTVDKFDAVVDRARAAGHWVIMLLHSIAPTASPWYATVDISAITGSIAHAKASGDVWIDTMANVGAYWRGQKLLSTTIPTLQRTSRVWTWKVPDHFPPGKYLRIQAQGGTFSQRDKPLRWDGHGYYEVSLDAGSLMQTW